MNAADYKKNELIQFEHCGLEIDKWLRQGAADRVRQAHQRLAKLSIPLGRVLVLGAHQECELAEFEVGGVPRTDVVALDLVPQFCDFIRERGYQAVLGALETCTPESLGVVEGQPVGRWNIYTSHMLEHCYDRAAAFEAIRRLTDRWCWVCIPIELTKTANIAHVSQFWTVDEVRAEFPASEWDELFHSFQMGEEGICGDARYLFVRKSE